MLPCCHVAMLPCCHVAMLPCYHFAMLPCSHVAMLATLLPCLPVLLQFLVFFNLRAPFAATPFPPLPPALRPISMQFRPIGHLLTASRRRSRFAMEATLFKACAGGDVEVVATCLDNGADLNAANADGLTALHFACSDHMDIAKLLIQKGANLDAAEAHGRTPLNFCCESGITKCAALLIDKGADAHALTAKGETALSAACGNGKSEVVKFLLQKGADPFAGVGLPAGPVSCVRLVTAHLANSGLSTACGSHPSLFLLPPPSSLTLC
jgi:hypothetical protein